MVWQRYGRLRGARRIAGCLVISAVLVLGAVGCGARTESMEESPALSEGANGAEGGTEADELTPDAQEAAEETALGTQEAAEETPSDAQESDAEPAEQATNTDPAGQTADADPAQQATPRSNDTNTAAEEGTKDIMQLSIGETTVPVTWEENASVDALRALCPQTVEMSMYGGFEQVGDLGQSIVRDDHRITTSPGDIVLYAGDQIVIFYGSNSWVYTRLGHIDLPQEELTELLGRGDVIVRLECSDGE